MASSFLDWYTIKEDENNNLFAAELILESLARIRPDISNQDWDSLQKSEKRSPVDGDIIITSADKFLRKKANTYNLRVGDFNFMVVSPDNLPTSDAVSAVGSMKSTKGHKTIKKDFDKTKLYDVTKAFIDDPYKRPNQRIFVFISNETEDMLRKLQKRTSELSGNVSMAQRADDQEMADKKAHFNAMKSLGVDPDKMAHVWRKKEAGRLNTLKQNFQAPPQEEHPDDLDDRILKFKQKVKAPEPNYDDLWNQKLAAFKS